MMLYGDGLRFLGAPAWFVMPIAALLTAALLFLLLRYAESLPVDTPNARSLHSRPIPRIGGLALIPGALGALLLNYEFIVSSVFTLVFCSGFLYVVSAVDDWHGLSVRVRLVTHILVGMVLGFTLSDDLSIVCMVVFVLILATNFYNFMDGANGLAGGMAAIGFAAMGSVANGSLATLAFALSGAALGFLFFNFHPARVFLGDAGSIPLGFFSGGIGVVGYLEATWPVWFPFLVFSPFVVDASATLLRRGLKREKVWKAHRDHYYQRLVRMGWSHRQLALMEYVLMAATSGTALMLLLLPTFWQWIGVAVWVGIYGVLMTWIDRRWQESPSA